MFIRAHTVAVATPCCPAPVSAMMRLAHLLGHENLTDGIVNFVCTGMVQVLALQIELASVLLAHALGIIKR